MKSRKYPSFDEAITYLESKGELTYWGCIGKDVWLYSLKVGRKLFRLYIYENGKVEIRE